MMQSPHNLDVRTLRHMNRIFVLMLSYIVAFKVRCENILETPQKSCTRYYVLTHLVNTSHSRRTLEHKYASPFL